jgi:serine protease Do
MVMRRIGMFSECHAVKHRAAAALLWAAFPLSAAFALPQVSITACAKQGDKDLSTPILSTPSLAKAVARNGPAVVSVLVLRPRRDPFEELDGPEFFQSLSGLPLAAGGQLAPAGASLERSFSSGFIVRADGYVLTSAHAVHDAQQVWVLMADGQRLAAVVVGFDRRTDVAVLKIPGIPGRGLPVVLLASSISLCAGEPLAAVGAPFGLEHSVTAGVVSFFPRFLPGGGVVPWIQTDVALNPGSSGGPVFNADGVVIGMSAMIFSATGIFMGVSFALPIDRAMRIARQLTSSSLAGRGHIGAVLQPMSVDLATAFGLQSAGGVVVLSVEPGGPADAAGLRSGDVLLAVQGDEQGAKPPTEQPFSGLANLAQVASPAEVEDSISVAKPGTVLALTIWRQRALKHTRLTVVAAPVEPPPRAVPKLTSAVKRLGLAFVQNKLSAQMPAGIYVDSATGPSLLAGIESGDRIIAVNNLPVLSEEDFDAALLSLSRHESIALLVERERIRLYVAVRLDTH